MGFKKLWSKVARSLAIHRIVRLDYPFASQAASVKDGYATCEVLDRCCLRCFLGGILHGWYTSWRKLAPFACLLTKRWLNLLEYKIFQHNIRMYSTKCEYRYYAGNCCIQEDFSTFLCDSGFLSNNAYTYYSAKPQYKLMKNLQIRGFNCSTVMFSGSMRS